LPGYKSDSDDAHDAENSPFNSTFEAEEKAFSFDNVNSPKTPITPQSNDESVATPLTPETALPSTPETASVF
jgi:hypothetical protein